MDSKFDNSCDGWCSNKPLELYGVRLWKNIMKELQDVS